MEVGNQYIMPWLKAIYALEDLAESFIDPRLRDEYTVKGITMNDSRNPERVLWPKKFRNKKCFTEATGQNCKFFVRLLNAAEEIEKSGQTYIQRNLHVSDLIFRNLGSGEDVVILLKEYGFEDDDPICATRLSYDGDSGLMVVNICHDPREIGDDKRFQKYKSFYERYIGEIFEEHAIR